MKRHGRRSPVVVDGGSGGGGGNWLNRGDGVDSDGCYSHESEPDLAAMVSDFLESNSAGAESRYSSDNDSGYSDLALLADRISVSIFGFCFCVEFGGFGCEIVKFEYFIWSN